MNPKAFLFVVSVWLGCLPVMSQITADFEASPLSHCDFARPIQFQNLSQGDTACLWDFGDGRTSTFRSPAHHYLLSDTFTVKLIVFGPTGTDTMIREQYVLVRPTPPTPSLSQNFVTASCGESKTITVSGQHDWKWYDAANHLVEEGNSLTVPFLKNNIQFRIRAEDTVRYQLGVASPADMSFGGFFQGTRGIRFDVYSDLILKSVAVEAGSAGVREIFLRNGVGDTLQLLRVNIPTGSSRIALNLSLAPGTYEIGGTNLDLRVGFSNSPVYPISIPYLAEMTGSLGNPNFYPYFFDWEIVLICKGNFGNAAFFVNALDEPALLTDTVRIKCGTNAQLIASGPHPISWYDDTGRVLYEGDTLEAYSPSGNITFYARSVAEGQGKMIAPPAPEAIGNSKVDSSLRNAFLQVEVFQELRLQSVLVHADRPGLRQIQLQDTLGNLIRQVAVDVPQGRSRIELNVDLEPGHYYLGGDKLDLLFTDSLTTAFPFVDSAFLAITGTNHGDNQYYYFYHWEVSQICRSEADSVVFQNLTPAVPAVNQSIDTVSCGQSGLFVAHSLHEVHWYDEDGYKVYEGDSLVLPGVTQSTHYQAIAIKEDATFFAGLTTPVSPQLGNHVRQGTRFIVHQDIILKSVLVQADTAGIRRLRLEKEGGGPAIDFSVFIPAGLQRVPINIQLDAGTYYLSGTNLRLFFTFRLTPIPYPFSVPGVIDIIKPDLFYGHRLYYYFYDFEVATLCKSAPRQVTVHAPLLAAPLLNHDSLKVGCGDKVRLSAIAAHDVFWYDQRGKLVAEKDSIFTPQMGISDVFKAVQEKTGPPLSVGPLDPDSLGPGMYLNSSQDEWLFFTVKNTIVLQSVWVNADSAGKRLIQIRRINGGWMPLDSIMIPAGKSRITIDAKLPPGDYQMGGKNLGLYMNLGDSPDYPFGATGLVYITSSSGEGGRYHFFYDWEIKAVCTSEPAYVSIQIDEANLPVVQPPALHLTCPERVEFIASGTNVHWYDQQGDSIARSDTLTFNRIVSDTTFYAQNRSEAKGIFGGPKDHWNIGAGEYRNTNATARPFFDVFEDVILKSVWINAGATGTGTIHLREGQWGTILQSVPVSVQEGTSRVSLNFPLIAGRRYQLSVTGLRLYYNTQGVNYPYEIGHLLSIPGTTKGNSEYLYFYDWELEKDCIGDPAAVPITFGPVIPPVLVQDTLTMNCRGQDTLVASSSEKVIWLDQEGNRIASGEKLDLSFLRDSTTIFAISETAGNFFKGGAADKNIGQGNYSPYSTEWLVFDVYEEVFLHSVKVYARTAGKRLFEYRDFQGNILDSMSVFLPVGESRVSLDFLLLPGQHQQLAINGMVDLYKNTTNGSYPYRIADYVTITHSKSAQPLDQYLYFYDWEVGDLPCQSDTVAAQVFVNPLPQAALLTPDTVCYQSTALLTGSSLTGSWYDQQGKPIGFGVNYRTPALAKQDTFFFVGESLELVQKVGPLDANSIGPGSYHQATFDAFLEFEVERPLRLNSVWVDAGADGMRGVILQDSAGGVVMTEKIFIPAGPGRLYLGWELMPGSYAIGGRNMDLFRNDNGPLFPYQIPGMLSIKGTNTGNNFYYYFYDWEVQEIPCRGGMDTVVVHVFPDIQPLFTYSQEGPELTFMDQSVRGTNWHWDFGDGDSSTLAHPTHLYADTGYFVVTLTVNEGFCSQQYTDTVYIAASTDAIERLHISSFHLFPNPGNGRFTLEAQAHGLREMEIIIYDLQGRKVYESEPQQTSHFREEVDLTKKPAGTYMVQLRVDGVAVVRRYVLR